MNRSDLPDPLKTTLEQVSVSAAPLRSCIESGSYAFQASMYRASLLSQNGKSAAISSPALLFLMPEERLGALCTDRKACDSIQGICVSEEDSPRENLQVLSNRSKVAIMTPSRAIDHLRRDNLNLTACSNVLVLHEFFQKEDSTPEQESLEKQLFFDDCRFIFTKLSAGTGIEIYCDSVESLSRKPEDLSEKVAVVPISSWYRSPYPMTHLIAKDHSPARIIDVLYALGKEFYAVVLGDNTAKGALLSRLGKEPLPLNCRVINSSEISTLQEPHGIESVTVVPVGVSPSELKDIIIHLFAWKGKTHQIVTLLTAGEAKQITMQKETLFMDQEKKLAPSKEEITAGKLQLLAAKVKVDQNPEELEALKKTFKKNVSFTQRANVTAFLLREYLGKASSTGRKPAAAEKPQRTRKESSAPTVAKTPQKAKPAVEIPEGSRTLYINIGKMRRLYARELSQVIQDALSIEKEEIYSIRVHDKYSFVTLPQEHAEKAIELLNGKEIRGRVASVSYSNKE